MTVYARSPFRMVCLVVVEIARVYRNTTTMSAAISKSVRVATANY